MLVKPRVMAVVLVLCGVVFSCKKYYSYEGGIKDTLPADYPYATGYCSSGGVSLGIAIADTVMYQPAGDTVLPAAHLLQMPVPGNQGSQQSCAAWATVYSAGSYYFHTHFGVPYSDSSNRSPAYTYNQVAKGNCVCTNILDHLYLMQMQGVPALGAMAYNPVACARQPDSLQQAVAANFKIGGWQQVNLHDIGLVKRALAGGNPVIFPISVDAGMEQLQAPYLWRAHSGNIGAAHALVLCGYDDSRQAFRFTNSWSTGWADGGFAWIDFDFFAHNVTAPGYIIL